MTSIGMRFLDEFSPQYSFKVMTKYAKDNRVANWDIAPELVQYLEDNNIEITRKECGTAPADVAGALRNLIKVACSDPQLQKCLENRAARLDVL